MNAVLRRSLTLALSSVWALATAASVVALVPPSRQHVMRFTGQRLALAPPSPVLELGSGLTMEAWVYLERYHSAILLGKWDHAGAQPYGGYALFLANRGGHPGFLQSDGSPGGLGALVAPDEIARRTWTHLAATVSEGSIRIFVNGVEVVSGPSPGPIAPNPLRFGVGGTIDQSGLTNAWLHGALREVRVWGRALSAAELSAGAGRVLSGREADLLAYWPLHDGGGQVARDLGPHHLHLQRGLSAAGDTNDPGWIHTRVVDAGPFFELEGPFEVAPGCDNRTLPCLGMGEVIDFDSDGDSDLLLARVLFDSHSEFPYAPMVALRNDGTGRFDDVSATVCPNVRTRAIANAVTADLDGDGRTDVFIGDQGPDHARGPGGQNRLLLQTPDGRLADVTADRLPLRNVFTHGVSAGDFTGDGRADLFVGPIFTGSFSGNALAKGPRLHLNDGKGFFSRGTEMPPENVLRSASAWSSVALDANRDGHLDLAIGGGVWQHRDTLLFNDGHGRLLLAPETSLPPRQGMNAMHMTSADLDGDGWADLLHWDQDESQTFTRVCLYLNNRNGTFRDASRQLGLERADVPVTQAAYPKIADLNGDGALDFVSGGFAGNGPRLTLNGGQGFFVEGEEFWPLFRPGTVAMPADFDGDGDVDVVLNGAIGSSIWLLRQVKAPDLSLLKVGTLPVRRRVPNAP